jgi:hypothetical protein
MKRIIEEKSKDKQSIYHIIYTKLDHSKNLIEILNNVLKIIQDSNQGFSKNYRSN